MLDKASLDIRTFHIFCSSFFLDLYLSFRNKYIKFIITRHWYFKKSKMRLTVYILTYVTYAACSAGLLCYSLIKVHLMEVFEINELDLGILDCVQCLTQGFATLLRYSVLTGPDIKLILLQSQIAVVVGFSLLPFVSFLIGAPFWVDFTSMDKYLVVLTCNIITGAFRSVIWQICLSLLNVHYKSSN
jgi:hypothetical protein